MTWKINLANRFSLLFFIYYKKAFVLSYLSNFNKPKTSDHATTITFICCLGYLLYFYTSMWTVSCIIEYHWSRLVFWYLSWVGDESIINIYIYSFGKLFYISVEWEWFWEIQEKKNWKGIEIEICGMKKNITKALWFTASISLIYCWSRITFLLHYS